jgi:hypothetical protein
MRLTLALTPLVLLAACAVPPAPATPPPSLPAPEACLLPSQHRMVVAELFFGRTIRDRLMVSDAEWADFLAKIVIPNFPDGLTVFDGYGQSRDPATGAIGRSPEVKIVLVAVEPAPDLPARLNAVRDAYGARFSQKSVGLITRESCAVF